MRRLPLALAGAIFLALAGAVSSPPNKAAGSERYPLGRRHERPSVPELRRV